jgi:GTP pyrophosphokinase
MRTEAMNVVAESGVAAHWLYKDKSTGSMEAERLGTQWLQSLLDIQKETRDASEFWDHVKVDLFPDAVYVFTPKSQIMSLPRGATVVDFAYMIHSNLGDHLVAAKINNQQVPLRTELKNGDVVEVMTAPVSAPNPSWLGFVRTGRARSRIRHHLKTMAHSESMDLGLKLLTQALRAEGIEKLPDDPSRYHGLWERIASIVAKRMAALLAEMGEKPDPLLMTRERFMANDTISQGAILLDGTENASVVYAHCCRPLPGDKIIGYLGRGEGLAVHTADCSVGMKLQQKDSERFIGVEWSDEMMRSFETSIRVTVVNTKGVLARVAGTLANSEVDIIHVEMGQASVQDAAENTFVISVRDLSHLETVLKNLKRTPAVLNAERMTHRVRGQSTAEG